MGGWVGGWVSRVKDCLQQSKMVVVYLLTNGTAFLNVIQHNLFISFLLLVMFLKMVFEILLMSKYDRCRMAMTNCNPAGVLDSVTAVLFSLFDILKNLETKFAPSFW
jgi:hypothetical protein